MNYKILVIEDDKHLAHAIETLLKVSEFDPVVFMRGEDAIDWLKESVPDLILCDIRLPGITGHNVLDFVRNDKRISACPFIFLTAYTSDKYIRMSMNEGADDYITKPFAFEDLLATIKARLVIADKNKQLKEERLKSVWLDIFNLNFQHEFLTPLNSMMNGSYLMQHADGTFKISDFKEVHQAIYSASFRLFRNCRNLITYAKILNNDFDINNSRLFETKVTDILKQTIAYFNSCDVRDEKNLIPKIDIESNWTGSTYYFDILFTELIDNALRFDDKQELPIVELKIANSQLKFSVTNNYSSELPFKVSNLAPFKKFHPDTSLKGLGIGLYICREICSRLNIQFDISQSNGKVTFCISTP